MNNKVYWTMKNGQQIDVDLMDENHLRNTLKMILRNSQKIVAARKAKKPLFGLNGDIAQSFVDDMITQQMYEEMDHGYPDGL